MRVRHHIRSPSNRRRERVWLLVFCLVGSPLFLLGAVALPVAWFWVHPDVGPKEGPEFTGTELAFTQVALAGYLLTYVFAAWTLWARWGRDRLSLSAFALPLPTIVLWMAVYLGRSDRSPDPYPGPIPEGWVELLYPTLLALILLAGALTASRRREPPACAPPAAP